MKNGVQKFAAAAVCWLLSAAFSPAESSPPNRFSDNADFIARHARTVVLEKANARAVIVPDWQARVAISTDDVRAGESFGWINREAIAGGILSPDAAKGTLKEHIHAFGGEERFWLAPEGGQFCFYFPPGKSFEFSNWKVPAALDTEPFQIEERGTDFARFRREMTLRNYSGSTFKISCERTVSLIGAGELAAALKTDFDASKVSFAAIKSQNRITNAGETPWTEKTGMPAIWLLGMFDASDAATIAVPIKKSPDGKENITDDYFGKIPPDRLKIRSGLLLMRADGRSRGKIGVPPECSTGMAAAYDSATKTLTLVIALTPAGAGAKYVNNRWEIQGNPFEGDAVNAYNDGPVNGAQMGRFFELETTSPALPLKPRESFEYSQLTVHLRGDAEQLDKISKKVLGAGIEEISSAFAPSR